MVLPTFACLLEWLIIVMLCCPGKAAFVSWKSPGILLPRTCMNPDVGWSLCGLKTDESKLSRFMNAHILLYKHTGFFLNCCLYSPPLHVAIAVIISIVNRMNTAQQHTRRWSLTLFWMTSQCNTVRFRDMRALSSSPTSLKESSMCS